MLIWVLVEEQLVHVSAFAELAPPRRPPSECPACRQPVILKLGTQRRHHAAHRPGDACVVATGESALHINAKCHLAAVLRDAVAAGATTLSVEEHCIVGAHVDFPGAQCTGSQVRTWAVDWDDVVIEYRLGQRVPDIVLLKAGVPVGAIEVFATHRVDDEKAAVLRDLGVPWLEVRAEEALFALDGGWTCAQPLRIERESPPRSWRCPPHEAEHLAELEERRHSGVIIAARIVDVYYPSGKRFRALWIVEERFTDGILIAGRMLMNGNVQLELPVGPSDPRSRERCAVRQRFQRTFEMWRERCASVGLTDSPMKWASAAHARQVAALAFDFRHFPRRYEQGPNRGDWRRPPELQHATWERQQGNWIDFHPTVIARAHKGYNHRTTTGQRAKQPSKAR